MRNLSFSENGGFRRKTKREGLPGWDLWSTREINAGLAACRPCYDPHATTKPSDVRTPSDYSDASSNESVEVLEAYYFPIVHEDLDQIVDLLRTQKVFAPSFVPTETEDVYHPLTYRRQESHHNTTTTLLPDRNVLTRWLGLLDQAEPTIQHRVSAAVMAFAQCSNIQVEPNLALYEAAMTAGSKATNEELRHFRFADNLPPIYWTEVALGRSPKLAITDDLDRVASAATPIDFEMPLRRWRGNYIILLKLAELDLQGSNRASQITQLAKWMHEDFLIGGPALVFAIYYLTPNSKRRGLLKNLRSSNRQKALDGIKNAAWDVTFLSDWISRISLQKANKTLTILCSLDQNLIRLANLLTPRLVAHNSLESATSPIRELFAPWGDKLSKQVSEIINQFLSTTDNPNRQINRPEEVNVDSMISAGEAIVRDWTPSSTDKNVAYEN
jgi:hypothetical protein